MKLSDHDYLVRSRLEDALSRILSNLQYETILDVGSGLSPYQKLFSDCNYIALDFEGMIDIKGDGEALPIKSQSIDLFLSTQTLEHVADVSRFLSEARRVLKLGGHAIISTHGTYPIHAEQDYWRWTAQGLERLFGDWHDVRVVPVGGYWLCLFQLMAFAANTLPFGRKPLLGMINLLGSLDLGANYKLSVAYVVIAR